MRVYILRVCFFFFNDTATTEIYTLSLHDALPIYLGAGRHRRGDHGLEHLGRDHHRLAGAACEPRHLLLDARHQRSEEHTSELQSQSNLVCRLLPEKKTIRCPRSETYLSIAPRLFH